MCNENLLLLTNTHIARRKINASETEPLPKTVKLNSGAKLSFEGPSLVIQVWSSTQALGSLVCLWDVAL